MDIGGRPVSRGLVMFLLVLPVAGLRGGENPRTQPTDTRAADVAALRELHDQVTAGQNAGDASVFERAASDVLVLPPDGSLIAGRQAHAEFNRTLFNTFTNIFDNKSEEIVVSGDWDFDRGTYRYTETPRAGGPTVVREGYYLWLASLTFNEDTSASTGRPSNEPRAEPETRTRESRTPNRT